MDPELLIERAALPSCARSHLLVEADGIPGLQPEEFVVGDPWRGRRPVSVSPGAFLRQGYLNPQFLITPELYPGVACGQAEVYLQ